MPDDLFSFLPKRAPEISHSIYCRSCFEETVAPKMTEYEELMDRAKEVRVYTKTQSKETRTIRRPSPPVHILDCRDHDEAVLRLAFLAALTGHNAVVDLQLVSKKVKDNHYQFTVWSGSAFPVNLDAKFLARDLPNIGSPN
jgi:hypothetical protein